MSRSYKKNPVVKDKPTKGIKRIANKKVRRFNKTISNGKSYKKIFESYDISDFSFTSTYSQYIKDAQSKERAVLNGGLDEYLLRDKNYKDWYKTYKMK